jgi:periplasmic divalent cation tolerance protein
VKKVQAPPAPAAGLAPPEEPDMPDAVIVLTTWPASRDAAELAHALVSERLAACVNVLGEMQSTYRWRNAVEVEPERQLVIKTTPRQLEALQQRLGQLHPYDVPEFLVLPVTSASDAYMRWLDAST